MGDTKQFLDDTIKVQLVVVFEQFLNPVMVKGYYDNSDLSVEMDSFMQEITQITDKVIYQKVDMEKTDHKDIELPSFVLYNFKGEDMGILFHGVPGGHEFNPFISALYNVAGPGKEIDESLKQDILNLPEHNIRIITALTCNMCPVTVTAAQKMASLNQKITAHMYDVAHFPNYREKYNIESVPCIIIDDEKVYFGKREMEDLIELLK